MKNSKEIVLISWSHVDLAFVEILEDKYNFDVKIIRYKHHNSWNSTSRSYSKNLFNLLYFVFKTLFYIRGRVSIFFGHHLCRIFFIFAYFTKKSFFIFNELPSLKRGPISYFDKLIFKNAEHTFVSNKTRLNLLKVNSFDVSKCKILENITFANPCEMKERVFKNNAIFIGTISNKRFGNHASEAIESVINNASSVDILPSFVDRKFKENFVGVTWLERVPHSEVNNLLKDYEFGILSYENDSQNNFHAAPLKIYEYVNMGLRVISLLSNEGIDGIKKKYPELFVDIELNSCSSGYTLDAYKRARKAFLTEAIETNKNFANSIFLHS
tara:strand:- start:100 stop:1080 length:981 start_codon:yes stop_codon:yes gene_type:complete